MGKKSPHQQSKAKKQPLTQMFSDQSIKVENASPMRNADSQQTIKMQNDLKNMYREPLDNNQMQDQMVHMPDMSNQRDQRPSTFEQKNLVVEVSPPQPNEPSLMR